MRKRLNHIPKSVGSYKDAKSRGSIINKKLAKQGKKRVCSDDSDGEDDSQGEKGKVFI